MKKTVIALTLAAITSASIAAEHGSSTAHTNFWHPEDVSTQQHLNVIDLSGKSFDEIALALAESQSGGDYGEPSDESIRLAKLALRNNAAIAPEYASLMTKRAHLLNISEEQAMAEGIHQGLAFDATVVEGMKAKGCTTMAFNTGIVGQTLDEPISHSNPNSTLVKTDNFIGMYNNGGFYQGMGKHVGVVFNYLGGLYDEGYKGDSFASFDAVLYAMTQAEDVEAAIEIAREYRSEISQAITLADDKGNVASIEVSANKFLVDRGNGRGVAHTNHGSIDGSGAKDFGLTDDNYDEINKAAGFTFARQDAADLFVKYTPELNVEAMQYAFETRPINLTPYKGDTFATIQAMVFDLNTGCAYGTSDNPRFVDYTKVCFN